MAALSSARKHSCRALPTSASHRTPAPDPHRAAARPQRLAVTDRCPKCKAARLCWAEPLPRCSSPATCFGVEGACRGTFPSRCLRLLKSCAQSHSVMASSSFRCVFEVSQMLPKERDVVFSGSSDR